MSPTAPKAQTAASTQAERLLLLEASQEQFHVDISEIKASVLTIQKEMQDRPSWGVTRYITAVTGLCMLMFGATLTYLLTQSS